MIDTTNQSVVAVYTSSSYSSCQPWLLYGMLDHPILSPSITDFWTARAAQVVSDTLGYAVVSLVDSGYSYVYAVDKQRWVITSLNVASYYAINFQYCDNNGLAVLCRVTFDNDTAYGYAMSDIMVNGYPAAVKSFTRRMAHGDFKAYAVGNRINMQYPGAGAAGLFNPLGRKLADLPRGWSDLGSPAHGVVMIRGGGGNSTGASMILRR